MKAIFEYTIYCTKTQTCKALELGAPINCIWNGFYEGDEKEVPYFREIRHGIELKIKPPTTEQMIGWLETQGFYFRLNTDGCSVEIDYNCILELVNTSRSDSTLAAIDAALNYLEQHKK